MTTHKWTQKVNLKTKHRYLLLGMALLIIILDQITKCIVRKHISLYEVEPVIKNFWNWTLLYNKGAAFGFMNDDGVWSKFFFGIVALVVAMWLIHYLLNKRYSIIAGVGLTFILGGAVGNLTDRILFGKVTDFIQWYYNNHYWPAFNVADSFVSMGVVLLIIEGIASSKGKV